MTFKPHTASTMLICLMLATASAQTGNAFSDQDSHQPSFDGFNVDEHLQPLQPAARAAFMEQIKIVESSSVPPDVLRFFKSVPIVVDPAQKRQPGEFASRDGRRAGPVFVQDRPMATNWPIGAA